MTYDFSNRCVVVTGGSRGIGRSICEAFAAGGAKVVVNYQSDEDAANITLECLEGDGHFVVQADVSNPEGAKKIIEETISLLGGLHIVVNNAGVAIKHAIADIGYDEWQTAWQKTIEANLIGPSNVCYCAARYMMDNGGGRIVNISSRGAFRGEPDYPGYGASKAGLNSLSQSLAIALAPHNIFVGVVAPGFVQTDMVKKKLAGPDGDSIRAQSPLGRVAHPEEVAHAALFLASDGAEFSTGTIIDVNGASFLRT